MEQLENLRFCLPQPGKGTELVGEENPGLPRVGHRVVHTFSHQFVIFNQPMIGILRETNGREDQSVDHRQLMDRQLRGSLPQNGKIMTNHVMTKKTSRPPGQTVEFPEEALAGAAPRVRQGRTAENSSEFENFAMMRNFEVEQQGALQ